MKKIIILPALVILLLAVRLNAQIPQSPNKLNAQGLHEGKWTILFDQLWKPTSDTAKAQFYRIINYLNGKPAGLVYDYYISGQKQFEGYLISDNPDISSGECIYYYENGQITAKGTFRQGKPNGKFTTYYENGVIKSNGEYLDGADIGEWIFYNKDGSIAKKNSLGKGGEGSWNFLYEKADTYFKSEKLDSALIYLKMSVNEYGKNNGKEASEVYIQLIRVLGNLFQKMNDLDSAEKYLSLAIEMDRNFSKNDDINLVQKLQDMASFYEQRQKIKEAELLYDETIQILRRHYKTNDPNLAFHIVGFAAFYNRCSDFKKTEFLLLEALDMLRQIYKTDHSDLVTGIRALARFYDQQMEFTKAEPLYIESLNMQRRLTKSDNPEIASIINSLANFYRKIGDNVNALNFTKEALEIRRRLFRSDNSDLAISIGNMASMYQDVGSYDLAKPLYEESLEMCRRIYKEDHSDLATCIDNTAGFYECCGDFNAAESFFTEALQMRRRLFKTDHPDLATSINNVASFYSDRGNYEIAEPLFTEALKMFKQLFKGDHPSLANAINGQALFYHTKGNYVLAEKLYKESLEMRRRLFKVDHPDLANAISNSATFYLERGNYIESELLHIEAMKMYKRLFKLDHPSLATSICNLAEYYNQLGNYNVAEPLYKEALEMRRRIFKGDHPDLANSLNNLASFYNGRGDYSVAEKFNIESTEMHRRLYKKDHFALATSINNLATFYMCVGNSSLGKHFYKESLEMRKRIYNNDHPDIASSEKGLASYYFITGKYSEAQLYLIDALGIYQRIYKVENHNTADLLFEIALNDFAMGSYTSAIKNYNESFSMSRNLYNRIELSLSEKEREDYWATIQNNFELFNSQFSMLGDKLPIVIGDSYNSRLFSKGMLLNSVLKMNNRILSSGDTLLTKSFLQWRGTRQLLSKLESLTKDELQKQSYDPDSVKQLVNDEEKILSKRSAIFAKATENKERDWRIVQKQLQDDEAAVELIRFRKFSKVWTDTVFYSALIITKETVDNPRYVLLENGRELENEHFRFYKDGLINGHSFNSIDDSSYGRYWGPITSALKGIKKVYLSLDGIYNSINIEGLYNTETGRYAGEERDIQIVTSTWDIIEMRAENTTARKTAELYGFPKYDMSDQDYASVAMNIANAGVVRGVSITGCAYDSLERSKAFCKRLPGTEREVQVIGKLLKDNGWQVGIFTDSLAVEERVKAAASPGVLMISTHGYFLSDIELKRNSGVMMGQDKMRVYENPLVRSGLIMAGACGGGERKTESGKFLDDGKLTAYEVMNMNLDSTELVVLSACETGLGTVKNGEGVYGLQRAFRQAGAKTVLMSLWNVNDNSTTLLMEYFFKSWLGSKSKREALKEAQLRLRENPKYNHPYFWAPFVIIGE